MLIAVAAVAVMGLFLLGTKPTTVEGQANRPAGIPEDNGAKGFQDQYGQYLVVPNWPKPLPDQEGKWTWGSMQGVYAENSNRVYVLQRGELPAMKRPPNTAIPQFGPSVSFPVNAVPFRNHSQGVVASPPNDASDKGITREGVDFRWKNILFIVNRDGNLVESWTQWDSMFKRPHAVFISPYDAEKNVWVVDDMRHQVYKFSNDGKKLLLTLGVKDPGDSPFGRLFSWAAATVACSLGTPTPRGQVDGTASSSRPGRRQSPDRRAQHFNTVHGLARHRSIAASTFRQTAAFRSSTKKAIPRPVVGGHIPRICQLTREPTGLCGRRWHQLHGPVGSQQSSCPGASEEDNGAVNNHGLTVDEEQLHFRRLQGSTEVRSQAGRNQDQMLGNRSVWK
jgi:hypothetical protein